ncbi:MAG TPA: DPP IV N-terminal domain-containing protein [Parafilimonas sp.]|nr:DPP IV N-terminal domain-containing protein [Parafilimonas sp.]
MFKYFSLQALFITCFTFIIFNTAAQQALPQYKPTHSEIIERYKASLTRDSLAKNAIFKTSVRPHWIKNNTAFWYSNILKDSTIEYVHVDAATGKKSSLFNTVKLADALSKATDLTVNTNRLWFKALTFNDEATKASFDYHGKYYQYNIKANQLNKIDSLPQNKAVDQHRFKEKHWFWDNYQTDSISPNKQYAVYIKNNNVFIQPVNDSAAAIQYTNDGSEEHLYGSLAWSPDSKYVIGYHIRPVKDSNIYYVLSSVPNTTRGQLKSYEYKQPGDPFTTYEMFIFPVQQNNAVKVNTPIIDFYDAPLLYWTKDNTHFYYERIDRGHQRYRLIEVDVTDGNTKNIIDEKTKTFIYDNRIYAYHLSSTNEFIYTSEKDGWQHIYLIDALTGTQKNEITKGEYVIKNIDSIDEAKRQIWFSAMGVHAGEDVYNTHYYRIDFDGNNLTDLTPATANHTLSFSPDTKYYLDTYSTLNTAPVTELYLTATGKKIAGIEQADISNYLALAKRLPIRFVAKGRDGVTDIYGDVFLPAEFDSTKRYPIVENIYAGPQDSYVPVSFMSYRSEMQSIADLGFIVVQLDGMGVANRSKAFHDVCWHNIADAGFPDRILWMKALAAKYPFVDTTRVGLYGTSAGGQNALGALLFHPEWYKAAVASCGCHDNRVDKQWWNEQWMGYPPGPWYAEQSNVTNAYKLQGALLLMVGEGDNNVPPESTYRVADALIKAKKTFEFLPLPGMDHTSGGEHGSMKRKDFFVQHLLGVQPPDRNEGELTKYSMNN